jgi:uncharacterized protein
MPPPRPPRKKGNGLVIALVIVGVFIGGFVVFGIALAAYNDSAAPSRSPSPSYSYTPTVPSPTAPSPSLPTAPTTTFTQPPATQPTRTQPTAPRPTQTVRPPRQVSPMQVVTRDRFYFTGQQRSVGCRESPARASNQAGAEAYYGRLLFCLNRAWPRHVLRGGDAFRPPRLVTWWGHVQSPCGSGRSGNPPFYCGSNETIYMNLEEDIGNYRKYPTNYGRVWTRMWTTHQLAHEYGHHLQELTGILDAYVDLRYDAPSYQKELEWSRRLELQASCLADVFIGSNKGSYPIRGESHRQWAWLIGHVTDLKNDHGDAPNHQYWARRGYNSRNPGACNTFVAGSSLVR